MDSFLGRLIDVEDAATETFELFSGLRQHGSDLGMLAPKDSAIEISIGPHDFNIAQSPGLLRSDHAQGTTGAAVWQSGARFAKWMVQCPILAEVDILQTDGTVLELGAGTGLVGSTFAKQMTHGRVVVSDMDYAVKLLRQNIEANHNLPRTSRHKARSKTASCSQVDIAKFDWEQDDARSFLRGLDLPHGVDLIVACDCIYNYALIQPFIESCKALCEVRRDAESQQPTICAIVQQLRQPDVFEEWLTLVLQSFTVLRLPEELAGTELSPESGFVVHLLILR